MFLAQKVFVTAVIISLSFNLNAQLVISGKVKNSLSKKTIAGASIRIDNSFFFAQSDAEGNYELRKITGGQHIIQASFIGFQTYTDTVELFENKVFDIQLQEDIIMMEEVIVKATRAEDKSAMAYTNLKEIAEQNLGQDLPYLLNQQPSVVLTSDAGAGIGYTDIKIRGVDASRINVTINGIPVNDAESQGTYWVDLPDIASSIDNIQVQRGVGTSTNGAGAFGASINILTSKLNPKSYGEYNTSCGSFNTFKNTLNVGTGLIDKKFAFDMRLSKISSDGFIDMASSNLKSYYFSGAYFGKKTIVKFITFSGLEENYQAWNGIPDSRLNGDKNGMDDYIIRNGLDSADAQHLLNSKSNTYNQFTFKSQVDHYKQDYYQLHFIHEFNGRWNSNVSFHYTKGKGYYEEYKKNQSFYDYGLSNITIGTDTINTTDLVRRRWLDNDFYGTTFSLNYNSNSNISGTLGGALNNYEGRHFGEITWARYALNSELHNNYYKNNATKTDGNIFIKINYLMLKKINLFVDMQYRLVNYSFLGYDNALKNVQQNISLGFINPKIGINYNINTYTNVYASYSIGNKEPRRSDYIQSSSNSRPSFETLNDLELGYKQITKTIKWGINLYYMNYKNQLVLTGAINDVGSYNRTNVAKSYRRGLELECAVNLLKNFTWGGNATFSENKIINFQEFVDNYDSVAQRLNTFSKTNLAFSPNIILGSTFTFEPFKNFKINFINKYVGEQFLDNSSNNFRKLNSFFVNDMRINYTFNTQHIREIAFILAVYNLFNEQYESNGYTYTYINGGKQTVENFYFPQAGINFMAGLSFKF